MKRYSKNMLSVLVIATIFCGVLTPVNASAGKFTDMVKEHPKRTLAGTVLFVSACTMFARKDTPNADNFGHTQRAMHELYQQHGSLTAAILLPKLAGWCLVEKVIGGGGGKKGGVEPYGILGSVYNFIAPGLDAVNKCKQGKEAVTAIASLF